MKPCAVSPDLYSQTVTAVVVPEGCNGTDLVQLAARNTTWPSAWAWARWRARCSASAIWGCLTDVMMLAGLATAEMCMADLGWPVKLGSGVAAAQEFIASTVMRWRRNSILQEARRFWDGKRRRPMYIPTFADVEAAHERILPYIHRTPVLTSSYINGMAGAELFFKCENFQKAGAFKARGASNAVFGLTR